MCTVSLVPKAKIENGFIFTCNRDEVVGRETIPPDFYTEEGVKIYYPKDARAGGTWLGISARKRIVCLMNGGFENHQRRRSYRKSRGVVTRELLTADNILHEIENYDFANIEPFTVILVDWQKKVFFLELVWDEKTLHLKQLPLKSHIWSSSPLYSSEIKELRKRKFEEMLKNNKFSAEELLKFHHSGGIGDPALDLVIDRGTIRTQSISQIQKTSDAVYFWYKDLIKNKIKEEAIAF